MGDIRKHYRLMFGTAIIMGGLCFAGASHAEKDKGKEARIAAAVEYEKTLPVINIIQDILNENKDNPQLALSGDEVALVLELYDFPSLRGKVISVMSEHFTVAELNLLAEFYSKPEGKSIMKKMPIYMAEMMPYIQQTTNVAISAMLAKRKSKDVEPKKLEDVPL